VYLPFVMASDDKHGAYLLRVYVELSKMGGELSKLDN